MLLLLLGTLFIQFSVLLGAYAEKQVSITSLSANQSPILLALPNQNIFVTYIANSKITGRIMNQTGYFFTQEIALHNTSLGNNRYRVINLLNGDIVLLYINSNEVRCVGYQIDGTLLVPEFVATSSVHNGMFDAVALNNGGFAIAFFRSGSVIYTSVYNSTYGAVARDVNLNASSSSLFPNYIKIHATENGFVIAYFENTNAFLRGFTNVGRNISTEKVISNTDPARLWIFNIVGQNKILFCYSGSDSYKAVKFSISDYSIDGFTSSITGVGINTTLANIVEVNPGTISTVWIVSNSRHPNINAYTYIPTFTSVLGSNFLAFSELSELTSVGLGSNKIAVAYRTLNSLDGKIFIGNTLSALTGTHYSFNSTNGARFITLLGLENANFAIFYYRQDCSVLYTILMTPNAIPANNFVYVPTDLNSGSSPSSGPSLCQDDSNCTTPNRPFCNFTSGYCSVARLNGSNPFTCAGFNLNLYLGSTDSSHSRQITWTAYSNHSNNTLISALNSYLATKLSSSVSINISYLADNTIQYSYFTFIAKFTSLLDSVVSLSYTVNGPCYCTSNSMCSIANKPNCVPNKSCVQTRIVLTKDSNNYCNLTISWTMNIFETNIHIFYLYYKNQVTNEIKNITIDAFNSYTFLISSFISQEYDHRYQIYLRYYDTTNNYIDSNAIFINGNCTCRDSTECMNSTTPICMSSVGICGPPALALTVSTGVCNALYNFSVGNSYAGAKNVTWSVNSNTTNLTLLNSLRNYLNGKPLSDLGIPTSYLDDKKALYSIRLSYLYKTVNNSVIANFYSPCSCNSDNDCRPEKPICIQGKTCVTSPRAYLNYTLPYVACKSYWIGLIINSYEGSFDLNIKWEAYTNSSTVLIAEAISNLNNMTSNTIFIDSVYLDRDYAFYNITGYYRGVDQNLVSLSWTFNTPCQCFSDTDCDLNQICLQKACINGPRFALDGPASLSCGMNSLNLRMNSIEATENYNINWTITSDSSVPSNIMNELLSANSQGLNISGLIFGFNNPNYTITASYYGIDGALVNSSYHISSPCSCSNVDQCLAENYQFCGINSQCYDLNLLNYSIQQNEPNCYDITLMTNVSDKFNLSSVEIRWTEESNPTISNLNLRGYLAEQSNTIIAIPNQYIINQGVNYFNFSMDFSPMGSKKYIPYLFKTIIPFMTACINCSQIYYPENSLVINYTNNSDITGIGLIINIDSELPYKKYKNQIIFTYSINPTLSKNFTSIFGSASNSTHQICFSYTLYFYLPPLKGSFIVNPPSGYSLITPFILNCSNWTSSNLPLSYKFYQYDSSISSWILLNSFYTSPTLNTSLTMDLNSTLPIRVDIIDSLGNTNKIFSNITINQSSLSFSNMISLLNQLLTTSNASLSVLSKEMASLENKLMQGFSNKCPSCSGNGQCYQTSTCNCSDGWTGQDCSFLSTLYNQYLQIKQEVLEKINTTTQNPDTVLYTLGKLSNPNFNDLETMTLIQKKFNEIYPNTSSSFIPSSLINLTTTLVDNMIAFSSQNDCPRLTNFTKTLGESLENYFNRIALSSLAASNNTSSETLYSLQTYDLFAKKISLCDQNITINTSSNAVVSELSSTQTNGSNCSESIILEYISLTSTLYNCSLSTYERQAGPKTQIAIKLSNSATGQNVLSNFLLNIISSPTGCPTSCNLVTACTCKDLSLFDFKAQFLELFANQNFEKITDFSALADWKFYEDFAFYLVCSVLFVSVMSLILIWLCLKSYCILARKRRNLPMKFWSGFVVSNSLLNSCFVNDPDISREIRVLFFFVRTILMILFTSIFNINIDVSVSFKFEFSWKLFSPYTILLPYITIIPFYNFVYYLVLSAKQRQTRLQKFKFYFGLTACFLSSGFAILASFILSATKNSNERLVWAVGFSISMFQDLVFTPIGYVFLQFLIYKLLKQQNPSVKPSRFISRLTKLLWNPIMIKIFEDQSKMGKRIARQHIDRTSLIKVPKQRKIQERKLSEHHNTETPIEDNRRPRAKTLTKVQIQENSPPISPNKKKLAKIRKISTEVSSIHSPSKISTNLSTNLSTKFSTHISTKTSTRKVTIDAPFDEDQPIRSRQTHSTARHSQSSSVSQPKKAYVPRRIIL